MEEHPELRGDAYCYAKVKQEQIVTEYGKKFGIPYVVVRPGSVYGAGSSEITGRVGIGTFGLFLHLGGSNTIPFTYVDNCADAIVLAGLVKGVDGEVFNVVDDELPSSRQFLRQYKKNVRRFKSLYVPHAVSHALCYLWERYSQWSQGQLPPVFNAQTLVLEWKKTRYSNEKLKLRLGWVPKSVHRGRIAPIFQELRQGGTACLGSPSWDAARSRMPTPRRSKDLDGCEIVGVCDREPLMAKQLYERFRVKRYFSDLPELVREARPDVVHITTPPESHFDIARFCLEHGCHVYVEKPFTLDAEEAQRLVDLANKNGLKLTAGHNYQFSHAARRMRALVETGLPGRPAGAHGKLLWL